jgi:hypothetical protein
VPAVALPAGRTGVFDRLRALPDSRAVDRLLRSRLWIWVVGAMLGGIVAMQVSLLRLNSGISRAVQTQDTLVRQNSDLEASIAQLTSGDRVREAAMAERMIDPPAGEARYLRARPATDPLLALKRMKSPSDDARAVMLNAGLAPGVAPAATPTAPVSGVAGAGAPIATATPAATTTTTTSTLSAAATPVATATPVPIATPLATATPVPTAVAPVPTAAPGTGAVQAPQG